MKRAIGTVVFLTLLGGAVTIGLYSGTGPQRDNTLGVAAEIPEGWHQQTFDNHLVFVTHAGFIVSNINHRFHYPDLGPNRGTSAWDMRGLPEDLVAVEVSRTLRFPNRCRRTSPFPLAFEDGEWSRGAFGSPRRLFIPACIKGDFHFGIHVWLGDEASAEDEGAARALVASIRPSD